MNWQLTMLVVLALGAGSVARASARADLKDGGGHAVGEATLEQTPHGVLLKGTLRGVTPGTHALHIHQVGRCDPPFKSAGDHFNPLGRQHGVRADGGSHAGDLPNVTVPSSGEISFELFIPDLTLAGGSSAILDPDGSALVLHAKGDDYVSQPAGNAGDRVACGVILPAGPHT